MSDVKATLGARLPMLKPKKNDKHLKECLEKSRKTQKSLHQHAEDNKNVRPLAPEYVTTVLSEVAKDDAIFTVDTGMAAVWAARYLRMTRGRRLIGFVQSWVHGERHATGNWGAICISKASDRFDERRRWLHHADGGFAHAGAI
jgi:pyruvate dehydrogenase (quinone)